VVEEEMMKTVVQFEQEMVWEELKAKLEE